MRKAGCSLTSFILFACEAGQLSGQEGRTRAGLLRDESWFFSPGVVQPLESGLGFLYLNGMRNGIEGLMQERLIDLCEFAKDADKLDALELTPAAALGSCRKKLPKHADDPEFYEKLLAIFKKYDIRYFFYIGGNDSMYFMPAFLADLAHSLASKRSGSKRSKYFS